MITRKVKVDTIEKVKNFTNEIGKFEASADLGSIDRRYTVDAKSILGVFSLDLSRPMRLVIYDDEKNIGEYEELLKKYEWKKLAASVVRVL